MQHSFGLLLTLLVTCGLPAAELPLLGDPDRPVSPEHPIGFRGDGTGRFLGATPPTTWDVDKGTNIRWNIELPTFSQGASPIVVNGKVIVASEPGIITCIDADSGEILWSRHVNWYTRSLSLQQKEQLMELWHDPDPFFKPENPSRRCESTDGEDVFLKAVMAEGNWDQTRGLMYMAPTRMYYGSNYAVPISDGRFIYIKNYWDTLACIDFDGNIRWIEQVEFKSTEHLISLKLIDGLLISKHAAVRAWNATTGALVWSLDDVYPKNHGWGKWGQPQVLRDSKGVPYLIGSRGAVVRATDGKHFMGVSTMIPKTLHQGGPAVHDGVIYFNGSIGNNRGHRAAIRVDLESPDKTGHLLWSTPWLPRKRGGSEADINPLVIGDHLYSFGSTGNITILSLADGTICDWRSADLQRRGQPDRQPGCPWSRLPAERPRGRPRRSQGTRRRADHLHQSGRGHLERDLA